MKFRIMRYVWIGIISFFICAIGFILLAFLYDGYVMDEMGIVMLVLFPSLCFGISFYLIFFKKTFSMVCLSEEGISLTLHKKTWFECRWIEISDIYLKGVSVKFREKVYSVFIKTNKFKNGKIPVKVIFRPTLGMTQYILDRMPDSVLKTNFKQEVETSLKVVLAQK